MTAEARQTERTLVRVAALQLEARGVDDADAALADATAAVGEAADAGAQLIVLPECSWPGYVLGKAWATAPWTREAPRVLELFAALAASSGAVLVVGLALPTADGGVENAVVVWDSDGSVAGQAAKRFLWHFDNRWFTRGAQAELIDTAVGRLGVVVCADARMPELPRLLALKGAQLLLDPTAWVTGGWDPTVWSNPQYEFMLRTRARENGLWTVAANKVGLERRAVAYCGRSCVIDPRGALAAEAAPDAPQVLLAEVDPAPAALPVQRRPELYTPLAAPTPSLPVVEKLRRPLRPADAALRIVMAHADAAGDPTPEVLDDLDAHLVVVDHVLDTAALAAPVLVVESADRAVLLEDGVQRGVWQRTHGPGAPADEPGDVASVGEASLAVLLGEEGLLPEMCRRMMLAGADVVVWVPPVETPDDVVRQEAATRAAENRVHVAVVRPGAAWAAFVADCGGAFVADSGTRRTVAASLSLMDSRLKQMAAGTDVVEGRQPELFGALVAQTPASAAAG